MINKLEYQKIEKLLMVNIVKTNSNLKIAVAWFTNPNLFAVLIQLLNREVEVELILSNEEINFINPKINYDNFIQAGGKLYAGKSSNLMHNKFCIIDNRYLINGSYNWTLKAEHNNYENVVLTDSLNLVNDFKSYYEFLKSKTDLIERINLIKTVSTISDDEKEFELDLVRKVNITKVPDLIKADIVEYDDDLWKSLDRAELLYLNMKHDECISYCKLMLKTHKNIKEFYYRISLCNWRLNNFKQLIVYAQKAIDLDNEYYEAYNLLGMGYSSIGKEQLSILNYDNCININPNDYSIYRNRSISYNDLSKIKNIPTANIKSYKKRESADLKKVLKIVDQIGSKKITYSDLESKAFANFYLGNIKDAEDSLELSLKYYKNVDNKFSKDKNMLKDIKDLQKQILNFKK